nr:hypothetical protein [Pseudonocardia sp.]
MMTASYPLLTGQIEVAVDLIGSQGTGTGFRLDQCGPHPAGPRHPDHGIGDQGALVEGERHLEVGLDGAGRPAEPADQGPPEVADGHHRRHQGRGRPLLLLLARAHAGDREEAGRLPARVYGQSERGESGRRRALLAGAHAALSRGRRRGGRVRRSGRLDGGIRGRRRYLDEIGRRAGPGRGRGLGDRAARLAGVLPGPGGFLPGILDGDAVVRRQTGESGVPPLADGTELPLLAAQVELTEDDRGLGAGVGDVEAHGGPSGRVQQHQAQILDVAEPRDVRVVQAGGDHDALDVRREGFEVDGHPVLTGDVIGPLAEQAHRPVAPGRCVVEDEVLVRTHPPVGAQQQCGHVDVGGPVRIRPSDHGLQPTVRDLGTV